MPQMFDRFQNPGGIIGLTNMSGGMPQSNSTIYKVFPGMTPHPQTDPAMQAQIESDRAARKAEVEKIMMDNFGQVINRAQITAEDYKYMNPQLYASLYGEEHLPWQFGDGPKGNAFQDPYASYIYQLGIQRMNKSLGIQPRTQIKKPDYSKFYNRQPIGTWQQSPWYKKYGQQSGINANATLPPGAQQAASSPPQGPMNITAPSSQVPSAPTAQLPSAFGGGRWNAGRGVEQPKPQFGGSGITSKFKMGSLLRK